MFGGRVMVRGYIIERRRAKIKGGKWRIGVGGRVMVRWEIIERRKAK
jgi:hypothetical protein